MIKPWKACFYSCPAQLCSRRFTSYYIGSKRKQTNRKSSCRRRRRTTLPLCQWTMALKKWNCFYWQQIEPAMKNIPRPQHESIPSPQWKSVRFKSAGLTERQRNSGCVNQLVNQEAALINSKLSGGWNSSLGFGKFKVATEGPETHCIQSRTHACFPLVSGTLSYFFVELFWIA